MKTLLMFCLALIGLAGFATGADAATERHGHSRPAYYRHHRYHHYYRHHHHRYHHYYRHHGRIYY